MVQEREAGGFVRAASWGRWGCAEHIRVDLERDGGFLLWDGRKRSEYVATDGGPLSYSECEALQVWCEVSHQLEVGKGLGDLKRKEIM